MFEKKNRLRIRRLLEESFHSYRRASQEIKVAKTVSELCLNKRIMTRKNKSKMLQCGYCEICHIPYKCRQNEHFQSSRHLKLMGVTNGGDNGDFLPFIDVDEITYAEVNGKSNKTPRTRNAACDKTKEKDTELSPGAGHRLRSRKQISYTYMSPPQEDDSFTEKPEREVRSSSRLLAKQLEHDDVWHSGRPKRACHRPRVSADERLVNDNKTYYKVDVLPIKLRSATAPFTVETPKPSESPTPEVDNEEQDKNSIAKVKKLRCSELIRLNNEAENFLFPKKDDSSDDEDDDEDEDESQPETNSIESETEDSQKHTEDDESMHSTSSESKSRKKRRTHAEAFILDNQKYYKFETPGSRLRYQGSYLSPVPMTKTKSNGDFLSKSEDVTNKETEKPTCFSLSLDSYEFSFESEPKNEDWYKTYKRVDHGEEKYLFLDDDYFWNPLALPYQMNYIPPLDPQECLAQYNQLRKCLLESTASTSTSCSTPDPQASNSSTEPQDEDSKISIDSAIEAKPSPKKRGRKPLKQKILLDTASSKNPRKSPRQHASTLAILSSLIQKRKRSSGNLSTIVEESPVKVAPKKFKVDNIALAQQLDEQLTAGIGNLSDVEIEEDDGISFHWKMTIEDMLNVEERRGDGKEKIGMNARRGRKPGRRKKNRTGWPMIKAKRMKLIKDANVNGKARVEHNAISETKPANKLPVPVRRGRIKHCVNNNKKRHRTVVEEKNNVESNCDSGEDRVKSEVTKVLNNNSEKRMGLEYQPYVRVQKLDRNHVTTTRKPSKTPKRTKRPQRKMPSPKSPRMLRKPRGRWYRER